MAVGGILQVTRENCSQFGFWAAPREDRTRPGTRVEASDAVPACGA
jgi:hypothetical protein